MMLDADVQASIVVDRTGAVQGIMTVERVIEMMREGDHGQPFAVVDDEGEPIPGVPDDRLVAEAG